MGKKVDKLNNLKDSVNRFEDSYDELLKNAKEISSINELGTMPEYPFCNSLDNIDIEKWTIKFKANIDNEIIKEMLNSGELYTKEKMSKKMGIPIVSLNRKIKKYAHNYEKKAYIIVKAKGSNGNRYLYTKDFLLYLQEMISNEKKKK